MEASTNKGFAGRGRCRAGYGVAARRVVGSAILLSGTVIFATEVSSYTGRPASPAVTTAAQDGAALVSK